MIGKMISHYRILERLGEGAMGVVYRAEDTKLKRSVALKFLSSAEAGPADEQSRFLREAQAAAALDHPNICAIHEIGEFEGQAYIIMACIEGESLEQKIKAGAIDLAQALEIAAQVADGLAAAHSKGIVHRDIKPSNLMITPRGQVKIMDFGLAKLAEATRLTKPGDTLGTLAYMSPEQVRGEDADHRSDIWSVGVVVYEMVTGRRPFDGAYSQAVIYSILNEKAPPLSSVLPNVPKDLEDLVDCCLAKEPDDRFQSADKLATAVRSIKPEESGVATATAAGVVPNSPKRAAAPSDYPREIAGYKILQCLGEGGMGMVYLAEQEKPVRRRVALKIIKLGMDTKEVIARFESERQALAMMSHPNIARIFNAGATEEGRPYFAMEYVPGEPITEYCDKHKLTVRERLQLFTQVCRAIHHAHQKAIIHRDIKASNILVTLQDNVPTPKVIDFGVAKATTQRLTERTVFTELGELVGTPEYMSPEQLEMTGLDVDTTTDVYSLGVLLYELLVGALPFEPKTLRQAGWDGLRRLIREIDPPRPSTRIAEAGERATEAAARRQIEIGALQKLVHGELDWITMRSLEKDRTRRYQSALAFAEDVERYLSDEAIQAGPVSTAYRIWKFVRRHRVPVAAAAAIGLAIIILGSVAVWQAQIARRRAHELWVNSVLTSAGATDDPLLKAQLVLELADLPEHSGRLAIAREAADHQLPVAVLRGHRSSVLWASFSPDGTRIVTSSGDSTARVWRADGTGDPVVLGPHEDKVWASFSPDGTLVLTEPWEGKAPRIWRSDGTGDPIVLQEHDEFVRVAAFSPDGEHVLTASGDGTIRLWSTDGTGNPAIVGRHDEAIVKADFSPDGSRVVVCYRYYASPIIWRIDGAGEPVVLPHPAPSPDLRRPVHACDFSPDGTSVVTGSYDSTACVWRVDGRGDPLVLRHDGSVYDTEFSPDGTRILTTTADGTAWIWPADGSGDPIALRGHTDALSMAAFSPDGTRVLTASSDGTARLWQANRTGDSIVLARSYAGIAAEFSPDGTWVVTSSGSEARVWRADDTGEGVLFGTEYARCRFSPDGTGVAIGSRDGTVRVWRADGTGEPLVLGRHHGRIPKTQVQDVGFSPDGTRVVSASIDGTARIWRVDGTEDPIVLDGHDKGAEWASFTADGSGVVTADYMGTLRLWQADGKGEPVILTQGEWRPTGFTPDGGKLVVLLAEDEVQVIPLDGTGEPKSLVRHEGAWDASFSPDGTRLATASGSDYTARIWQADGSGEPVVLRGHTNAVFSARFSPDGTLLATASYDGTARVWPADGEGEPLVLPGQGSVYWAEFSPDGTRLLTTGNGPPLLRRVTWPALHEYLRENTRACLTPEERMKYLAETPDEAWKAYAECERRQGRTPIMKRPE